MWFSNNRGTIHGQKHDTYTIDDKEFWDFSHAEMGIYDDVANTKFVYDQTGEKISYFGYSMGTTQILYGLAHDKSRDFFAEHMRVAGLQAPCTVTTWTQWIWYNVISNVIFE